MTRTCIRLLLLSVPVTALGLWILAEPSGGVEPEQPTRLVANDVANNFAENIPAPDVLPGPPFRYVGAAGCAAANCHGGDSLKQLTGSEHSIWIQRDPHADAYSVLHNEVSQRIMDYLGQSERYKELKGVPAWRAKICLDCHASASEPALCVEGHKDAVRDGVSCEGCHGPAEKWLDPHKRWDWQYLSADQKAALGFVNTDDLLTRSRMCASCHIGDANREVNHDIMAGGHPRLNFEMAAFHAILPAHWNPNEDRRRHAVGAVDVPPTEVQSSFQAKLWAIGQAAAAEKSLELLQARAENPQKVWPEFTEYGCYACHHDLQPSGWRQERGFATPRPGQYPYGTWQFAVLPLLAGEGMFAEGGRFAELSQEMARPIPDRGNVARLVEPLRQDMADLGQRWNQTNLPPEAARQLFDEVVRYGQAEGAANWDSAAQSYLGAVAAYQALLDLEGRLDRKHHSSLLTPGDHEVLEHFRQLRSLLKFDHHFDSPHAFEETAPDRVEALKNQFRAIDAAVE